MIARLSLGLTPRQATAVIVLLFASLAAALVLAWYFRRRNRKPALS